MRAIAPSTLLAAALALCLLAASAARAESPYVEGLELYRQGRYDEAAKVLRQALPPQPETAGLPAPPPPPPSETPVPPTGQVLPPDEGPAGAPPINPETARLRAALGFTLLRQNRLGEAEEQFALVSRAASVDALNDASIRAVGTLGLGWSAFARGKTSAAVELLNEAVAQAQPPAGARLFPDILRESVPAHARLGLGLIALGRGQAAEARGSLEAATKGPDVLGSPKELWLALGDARAQAGDAKGAQDAWAEVPRKSSRFPGDAPRDELAKLKSARLLESGGDREGALAAYGALVGGKIYPAEALQGQARMLLALGRAGDALPVLRRLVALAPNLAEPMRGVVQDDARLRPVYKEWGLSYFHHAQYLEALSSLSAYLDDVDPRDYACHMGMGWSFLRLGYSQRSRDSFGDAAEIRPDAADPLAGKGAAALALGRLDEARQLLEHALALAPDNALALNALGHLDLAQGDSQKALEHFRAALKSRPDYVESRLAVARILFDRAEYDAAAAEFFRLVTQEKRSTTGWNGLGWSRMRLGQYEDAKQAFAEERRITPSLPAASYGLGIVLARQGRTAEAGQRLAEAIFLSPEFAATPEVLDLMRRPEYVELYLEMGEAYARKLYPTAAAPYLEEYLKQNPNSRPGRRSLAWASFWAGQEDKAHALFQTLLIVNKDDQDAHLGDGLALLSRNHLDLAEPHLRDAVRLAPHNSLAWRALALLLQRQGKEQEAAATLRSEPKSRMERLDRMSASGFAALAEGRVRDAVADFRRAVALDPGLAAPHYGLAFALVSLGDPRQARDELLSGLNLDPAFLDEEDLAKLFARHAELGGLGLDLAWSQLYALNLPAARAGFERILKASPGSLEAQFGLGATGYLQADWQLAESCFDKLLPRAPLTSPSWDKWSHLMDKLGWAAYHQKKYDKALHAFDWLRTYHPETPYAAALAGMGWSLMAKDKPAQAQNLFLRSLKIFPRNLTAMQGLIAMKKDVETDEGDLDEPEPAVVQKSRHKKSSKLSRAEREDREAQAERPSKSKKGKKSKKSKRSRDDDDSAAAPEKVSKSKRKSRAAAEDAAEAPAKTKSSKSKVSKSKKSKDQDEAQPAKKKKKRKKKQDD